MRGSKSFVFRFADFEVRERDYRLIQAGKVLPVEPKAFRVLLFLLHNPQRLIAKEELLEEVWSDSVVSENSLARNIALLRRLLGDDFREPRYIATVAAVGYRFVCPIEIFEESQDLLTTPNGLGESNRIELPAHSPEAETNAPERTGDPPGKGTRSGSHNPASRNRRPQRLASAIVLAAALAALIWYLRRPLPPPRISDYTQITHDGSHSKGIFGTDGPRLYLNIYPDPAPVGQVSVSGGEIARIPMSLPNPWVHDVSPAGSKLLVSSIDGNRPSLWSVAVLGGSLHHLVDGDIGSAAWSPDGNSVVYSLSNGDIDLVRSDGTSAHRLASMPYHTGNALLERLTWSPDGKTIRFDRDNRIFEVSSAGSGDSTGVRPFLPGWHTSSWQCCGQWTPDGKFFIFLSWDAPLKDYPLFPQFQIWALDERRGPFRPAPTEPVQLTSGPIRWGRPILSTDGKKIFARGVILNGELVRFDARSHQFQPFLGGISAESVSFSPDGQHLAYVTFPEGILWKANRDGSNPTQLTDPPLYPGLPRWSPDGTQILFSVADSVGHSIAYLLSSQGGVPRPLLPGDKQQSDPNWSPDGRKIVFDTLETSGGATRPVIRILDLASRQLTTVPGSFGVRSPRWSPDGQFLAALTSRTSHLTVFNFGTQRWSVIQTGSNGYPTWSRDGRFIYFVSGEEDRGLFRISPTGGKAERVVDLRGFRLSSVYGFWMGLDPEDTPLFIRDIGSDDIYALNLEQK